MMKRFGCIVFGVIAAVARATEYTDPIYLLGDEVRTISVSSGTDTYSGAITGAGSLKKTGSGTLVLASENNTFDGGIEVNGGTLTATKSGAFGSGEVVCSASTNLRFAAPDGVFANDFGRLSSIAATSYIRFSWYFDENTTLTGDLDFPAKKTSHILYTAKKETGGPDTGLVIWEGTATSPSPLSWDSLFGTYQFKGPLKISELHAGTGDYSGAGGRAELYSSENTIGIIRLNNSGLVCCAKNVLGNAKLCVQGGGSGCSGKFDLSGYDQTVSALGIYDAFASRITRNFTGAAVDSADEKATLTIVGRGEGLVDTNNLAIVGHVALTLNAPGFRQLFTLRDNTTDGDIRVQSGTMELINGASFTNVTQVTVDAGASLLVNSTTASLFGAVTNLTVAGTLTCSDDAVTPFGTNAVLALSTDSSVTFPAGSTVQVAGLTLNGSPIRGEISAGDSRLPQLKGGNIVVRGLDYATSDVWTGKGDTTSVALAGNWQSETMPDFVSGNFSATLAAADAESSVATVDCNARFLGLNFTALDGFNFLSDGTTRVFSIGTNGVTAAAAADEHSPLHAFQVPVTLTGPQAWNVGAGATVSLQGGSSVPACTQDTTVVPAIDKQGTGVFEIFGNNVWDGQLSAKVGDVLIGGTITTSSGPDDIKLSGGNDSALWNKAQALYFDMVDGGILSLSNAVIEKATMIRFGTDSKYRYSVALAGTTNYFNAFFRTVDASRQVMRLEQDAAVVFTGGGRFNFAFGVRGPGTAIFRNQTFVALSGSAGFYVVDGARAVFEVGGHSLVALSSGISGETGGSFDFKVDDVATANGCPLKLNTTTAVNLFETTQHFSAIAATKSDLTGAAGSQIVLTDGAASTMTESIFSGAVSYCHASTNTMIFAKSASTSTGSLEVQSGTVTFAADASWTTVSNVTVKGTGLLAVNANNTFGKHSDLYFAGAGILSIPEGVALRVNRAFVEADEIPVGTYTYETAPAALKSHLDPEAGGTLSVSGNRGLTIIIR